jgi:hypothetical protein
MRTPREHLIFPFLYTNNFALWFTRKYCSFQGLVPHELNAKRCITSASCLYIYMCVCV